MLSFELSAIDLILVIAVVILLILYITRPTTKAVAEEKLSVKEGKQSKKPAIEVTQSPVHPPKDFAKCSYNFGYLKKLGKNAAIPDECLSCSRIMECSSVNE